MMDATLDGAPILLDPTKVTFQARPAHPLGVIVVLPAVQLAIESAERPVCVLELSGQDQTLVIRGRTVIDAGVPVFTGTPARTA